MCHPSAAVRASVLLCVIAALAVSGCGRIERTRQCMQLIARVNGALEEIAARQDAGSMGPEAEREIATRYERLAADLETLSFDTPGLGKAVTEYRDVLGEAARLVRRAADARERSDAANVSLARRELANILRREKMLTARIDSTCQSP